jgi:predicted DNA-binding transcriptional regulator AlpA
MPKPKNAPESSKTPTPDDPLLKPPGAAGYIQMSEAFLAKARRFGRGPQFVRIGNKCVRYRVSALEQFLREQVASQ